MASSVQRGEAWWAQPGSERTWRAIAVRLERSGLEARGRTALAGLDVREQRAVSDLLGRAVTAERVSVDLAALDERLRRRAGLGVVQAAQALCGPLLDRPSARADTAAQREAPFAAYQEWVRAHLESDLPWTQAWLEGLRRDGVLARDSDPVRLLLTAAAVLHDRRSHLGPPVGTAGPPVARTELAARLSGDAHALDDDRRLAGVVLRAVAAAHGLPPPDVPRRVLWEQLGVLTDTVSSTALVLGASAVRDASENAVPEHLSWWQLRRGWRPRPDLDVLVCENPRVLEAVAEQLERTDDLTLSGRAVLCTQGRAALVVVEVLARLRDAGARLRYHGDFDWAGLAIANEMARRLGVQPWKMSAPDYLEADASMDLLGTPVEPVWDPELGQAMRHRGLVVHEEAMLPGLARRFLEE